MIAEKLVEENRILQRKVFLLKQCIWILDEENKKLKGSGLTLLTSSS